MIDAAATRLGDPGASPSGEQTRLTGQIAEFGWRTTGVQAPSGFASYSYTAGFWLTFDQPEIVAFDLTEQLRHDLFGLMARDIGQGRRFVAGEPVDGLIAGDRVWLMPVGRQNADAYLPGAAWFYRGAAFPCWQLVWGDSTGRFPWDAGFDPGLVGVQPDLSAGGDWGGCGHLLEPCYRIGGSPAVRSKARRFEQAVE